MPVDKMIRVGGVWLPYHKVRPTAPFGGGIVVVPGAKPDATNTGARISLTVYTGAVPRTIGNITYTGIDFTAQAFGATPWTGSNLTFIDCALPKFFLYSGGTNLKFQHCNMSQVQLDDCSNVDISFNNMQGFSDDPIQIYSNHNNHYVTNVNVQSNWMHNAGILGAHCDGLSTLGCDGVTINGNFIDIPYKVDSTGGYVNSCLLFDQANPNNPGAGTRFGLNITCTNNWLRGGGYTFRIGNPVAAGQITFVGNRFDRLSQWGPFINANFAAAGNAAFASGGVGNNVWDDDGTPLSGILGTLL